MELNESKQVIMSVLANPSNAISLALQYSPYVATRAHEEYEYRCTLFVAGLILQRIFLGQPENMIRFAEFAGKRGERHTG